MNRIKQRAPYAPQACNWCRHKRIKCVGSRPVCQPCQSAGRAGECSFGPEPIKRAGNREYVTALAQYVAVLERELELCRKHHGGFDNDHLLLRPELPVDDDQRSTSDAEDDIEELMRLFQLNGGVLNFYGRTSPFQFAQPRVPRHLSRFPEIAQDASLTYVLFVEGVDASDLNPNFDWFRHLPQEVHFDRREHDKLLDLLFKFLTSWCLRIVPALFLRDMCRSLSVPPSQPPPKTRHYSPMLHNALIALAAAFSDDPQIQDLKFRQCFARRAKSYIDSECCEPDISVMNALSILGSFHSSLGEQQLGYMYFGMSGRASQALGLSVDCSRWVQANVITHDEMLDRNWAHWNTFALDVCWSCYLGRDFSVAAPPRRAIPIPFVDSEFDKMPWHHPPSGIPPQPNHLSSTFAATCNLLKIGRRIMEIVHTVNSPVIRQDVTNEVVFKLNVELNAWKDGLSPEVDLKMTGQITATPHRIMLQLAFWWLSIILHRPFYRRTKPIPGSQKAMDHVKICDRAARNIVELLTAWKSLYTLRYVPVTLVGIVFSAGTVFLLSALQTSTGTRPSKSYSQSLAQANLCVEYLLESGKSFQCANVIAEILGNLLQEGTIKSRAIPIPSSSMHRQITEIPDSPIVSPQTSFAAESAYNTQHPESQPSDIWTLETMASDLPDSAGLPEDLSSNDYWVYLNHGMYNENITDPTASSSNSASSSYQECSDLGAAMRMNGSMYLEGGQWVAYEDEGSGTGFPLSTDMEVFLMQALNAQYPNDMT